MEQEFECKLCEDTGIVVVGEDDDIEEQPCPECRPEELDMDDES